MTTRATLLAVLLAASPALAAPPSPADAKAIDLELVACGTRLSISSWTDPKRGVGCGRDVVVKHMKAVAAETKAPLDVVVDVFEATSARTRNAPVHMENVLAILPGKDPLRAKTAFVISGHFDSMPSDIMNPELDAPGADDDASGTTVSILAARAVSSGGPRRATLVFAAVSGEEQGLLGAKRLVTWLAEKGYTVGGMATNDIVGATNGSSDRRPRVFSEGGPDGVDSPSRELARRIEEVNGKDHVRLVFRRDRFGRGGDHSPFVDAGLPAVRFTEPLEDYRHQHQTPRVENGVEYGDLPKYLDFDFIAADADANARWLAEVADAPAPPRAVKLTGAVTPSAKIGIEAEDDPDRAGFEVLHRETTDPRWSVLRTVEKPGEVVLENTSTDNEYFAVRSVGKNGKKSLAVPAVAPPRPPAGSTVPSPTAPAR
jgi:hypothetical protein